MVWADPFGRPKAAGPPYRRLSRTACGSWSLARWWFRLAAEIQCRAYPSVDHFSPRLQCRVEAFRLGYHPVSTFGGLCKNARGMLNWGQSTLVGFAREPL